MPRPELTAATVAVKLHKKIKEELTLPIHEVIFWTDSTIVLQYINSHTKFQIFVANRLATIPDLSNPSQWCYVSSDLNPADIASHGLRPHERAKLKICLEGPKFLLQEEDHWPVQSHHLPDIRVDDRNLKPVKKAHTYVVKQDLGANALICCYSSSFAVKAFTWLIRFQTYMRYQAGKITVEDVKNGELFVGELLNAEEKIVKRAEIVLPQGTGSTIE